jgi:hypothetical protein
MTKSAPVTFPVRSLARRIRSATSCGSMKRPVAVACTALRATPLASPPCALATVSATPLAPSHSPVVT